MKKRLITLLLAAVMLLTPALALAAFDPSNVNIDDGSVSINATNTTQGSDSGAHGDSVNITSGSGTATTNTVAIDTTGGAVDVSITDVTHENTSPGGSPFLSIVGDGEADVKLNDVTVTDVQTAIMIGPAPSGASGPDVDLDMTNVAIATSDDTPAIRVNNASVDSNVNGANDVTALGPALSVENGAQVTVTGDTAGDALNLSSNSPGGTVKGDNTGSLTVEGKATVTAGNLGGAEPVQGVTVSGEAQTTTGATEKITTITASAPPPAPPAPPDSGGDTRAVQAPIQSFFIGSASDAVIVVQLTGLRQQPGGLVTDLTLRAGGGPAILYRPDVTERGVATTTADLLVALGLAEGENEALERALNSPLLSGNVYLRDGKLHIIGNSASDSTLPPDELWKQLLDLWEYMTLGDADATEIRQENPDGSTAKVGNIPADILSAVKSLLEKDPAEITVEDVDALARQLANTIFELLSEGYYTEATAGYSNICLAYLFALPMSPELARLLLGHTDPSSQGVASQGVAIQGARGFGGINPRNLTTLLNDLLNITNPQSPTALTGKQFTLSEGSGSSVRFAISGVETGVGESDPLTEQVDGAAVAQATETKQVEIPTVEELKELGGLSNLNVKQIAALTKAHIEALTAEQIRSLYKKQLGYLTWEQIGWMTKEQFQALTTEQIGWLTKEHIQNMLVPQIAALTEKQIQALTTEQIGWLSEKQIQNLSGPQIQALTEEQIAALTEEQIAAMFQEQRDALEKRKKELGMN